MSDPERNAPRWGLTPQEADRTYTIAGVRIRRRDLVRLGELLEAERRLGTVQAASRFNLPLGDKSCDFSSNAYLPLRNGEVLDVEWCNTLIAGSSKVGGMVNTGFLYVGAKMGESLAGVVYGLAKEGSPMKGIRHFASLLTSREEQLAIRVADVFLHGTRVAPFTSESYRWLETGRTSIRPSYIENPTFAKILHPDVIREAKRLLAEVRREHGIIEGASSSSGVQPAAPRSDRPPQSSGTADVRANVASALAKGQNTGILGFPSTLRGIPLPTPQPLPGLGASASTSPIAQAAGAAFMAKLRKIAGGPIGGNQTIKQFVRTGPRGPVTGTGSRVGTVIRPGTGIGPNVGPDKRTRDWMQGYTAGGVFSQLLSRRNLGDSPTGPLHLPTGFLHGGTGGQVGATESLTKSHYTGPGPGGTLGGDHGGGSPHGYIYEHHPWEQHVFTGGTEITVRPQGTRIRDLPGHQLTTGCTLAFADPLKQAVRSLYR